MARKPAIPVEIKEQAAAIVNVFNQQNKTNFQLTFKGKFGYLSKTSGMFASKDQDKNNPMLAFMSLFMGEPEETKLGRITWTGDFNSWDFAVYRYSRNFYDPDEWMFPGSEHLNGTIEGALKAGMELYP